jgi:hypothetical protein
MESYNIPIAIILMVILLITLFSFIINNLITRNIQKSVINTEHNVSTLKKMSLDYFNSITKDLSKNKEVLNHIHLGVDISIDEINKTKGIIHKQKNEIIQSITDSHRLLIDYVVNNTRSSDVTLDLVNQLNKHIVGVGSNFNKLEEYVCRIDEKIISVNNNVKKIQPITDLNKNLKQHINNLSCDMQVVGSKFNDISIKLDENKTTLKENESKLTAIENRIINQYTHENTLDSKVLKSFLNESILNRKHSSDLITEIFNDIEPIIINNNKTLKIQSNKTDVINSKLNELSDVINKALDIDNAKEVTRIIFEDLKLNAKTENKPQSILDKPLKVFMDNYFYEHSKDIEQQKVVSRLYASLIRHINTEQGKDCLVSDINEEYSKNINGFGKIALSVWYQIRNKALLYE